MQIGKLLVFGIASLFLTSCIKEDNSKSIRSFSNEAVLDLDASIFKNKEIYYMVNQYVNSNDGVDIFKISVLENIDTLKILLSPIKFQIDTNNVPDKIYKMGTKKYMLFYNGNNKLFSEINLNTSSFFVNHICKHESLIQKTGNMVYEPLEWEIQIVDKYIKKNDYRRKYSPILTTPPPVKYIN